MHSLLLAVVAISLAGPAVAGTPYNPLKLEPAQLVTPPPELLADAKAFFEGVKNGDIDAITRGIATKVTTVDGSLELAFPRHKEVIGPHDTTETLLSDLANFIGGIVEEPAPGGDPIPLRIAAERDYILSALSDDRPWGLDPMFKDAICSYAYRRYDLKAIKALSEKLGVASSSFVYVNKPYALKLIPSASAEGVGTMETDLLYALDYDTDAPSGWMAVYLPDGRSGFASFEAAEFSTPYAAGICFNKNQDGHWVMVGQASTSL